MNDYISKQVVCEALDNLSEYFDKQVHELIMSNGVMNARSTIMDIPTIDAVPVVRCGECKFNGDYDSMICPYLCDDCYYDREPDKNGYCNKGERKDDNT